MHDTDSFILKQIDYKERDKILTFLTKESGKKAGILRGAKSFKSQNVSLTELFSHVHLHYVEKSNQDLVSIRKCNPIESYYPLRQDYEKYLYASYFTELILLFEIPPQDSPAFFQLYQTSLEHCQNKNTYPLIKFEFEMRFLHLLGIFPNLECCIQCQQKLWDSTRTSSLQRIRKPLLHQLDSREGGIRCPDCYHQHPDLVSLSPGTLAYLQHRYVNLLASNSIKIKETLQNLIELDQAFGVYFRHILGKKPKSHAFLSIQ
ncbi:DNA repair protein RecO [Deltaproteobacteria bacterium TL4]